MNGVRWLVFVKETSCFCCEAGPEYLLRTVYTNLELQIAECRKLTSAKDQLSSHVLDSRCVTFNWHTL